MLNDSDLAVSNRGQVNPRYSRQTRGRRFVRRYFAQGYIVICCYTLTMYLLKGDLVPDLSNTQLLFLMTTLWVVQFPIYYFFILRDRRKFYRDVTAWSARHRSMFFYSVVVPLLVIFDVACFMASCAFMNAADEAFFDHGDVKTMLGLACSMTMSVLLSFLLVEVSIATARGRRLGR